MLAPSEDSLLINAIISYHFGRRWFVHTSPNITVNRLSASGDRWALLAGAGARKVVRISGQPVKLSLDSDHNVVHPHGTGPVWSMMFTLTLLFTRQGAGMPSVCAYADSCAWQQSIVARTGGLATRNSDRRGPERTLL